MTTINEKSGFNSLSPEVALIHQIIDEVIRLNGGGLTDLSAYSTTAAMNTAIADAINSVVGGAPSALNTLYEIAQSLNNNADLANTLMNAISAKVDSVNVATQSEAEAGTNSLKWMTPQRVAQAIAALSPSGVTAFASLTDKTSADLPGTNGPLATALAGKADVAVLQSFATGATLGSANNNTTSVWTGTADGSAALGTSGSDGDFRAITNPHATAVLTMTGGSTPTGKRATVLPGETNVWSHIGGVWVAQTDTASAGTFVGLSDKTTADLPSINAPLAAALAAISGSALVTVSGTNAVGQVLTATFVSGWSGTVQWQRDGSNISGATANTYTVVSADAGHNVRPVITSLVYTGANRAIPAAPVFTADSPPGGTNGTAYSYTFVATGATSYAVASGTLPTGLSLNTSTGVLSGTPSAAGTFTFTISATGSGGTTTGSSHGVVISSGSSAVLTLSSFTSTPTTSHNVSTGGAIDWLIFYNGHGDNYRQKTGVTHLIPTAVSTPVADFTIASWQRDFGGKVLAWVGTDTERYDGSYHTDTDGDSGGDTLVLNATNSSGISPNSHMGFPFAAPTSATRTVRFWLLFANTDHNTTLTLSIGDASTGDQTLTVGPQSGYICGYVDVAFRANSSCNANLRIDRNAAETGTVGITGIEVLS